MTILALPRFDALQHTGDMSSLRLVLAGAAIGNGNRGVEALARSVVDAVERERPHGVVSVLDDGWGVRPQQDGRYPQTDVEFVGARRSRRWHRPESWAQVGVAQKLGVFSNPVAQRFASADAILDLSAGDSFTDLYGHARLATVSAPKAAALRAGKPLVLLPQTYGPFETERGRRSAERLIRSAALAYARDPWSYDRLVELAGPNADQARLCSGVDVAFALEPRRPGEAVVELVMGAGPDTGPRVGVNVSGLLREPADQNRFGLARDYVDTMTQVVQGLLADGAHVVFVPHVHADNGAGESDVIAIREILTRVRAADREQITQLPPTLDAAELKWCIGALDWFVGSRMHATIAALSTVTPCCAYAYSDKTLGVFQTCGVGEQVIDARLVGGQDAAEAILSSYAQREAVRQILARRGPETAEAARSQLRDVLDVVGRWRDTAAQVESIA